MMSGFRISFNGVCSCRSLERVSKECSEGHSIAHMTTGHEQGELLELVGAVVG